MIESKFAEISDLKNPLFAEINNELQRLNLKFALPDHTELNRERFNNEPLIISTGTFYGSRMWEYPFAIINSELSAGLKVADIGCGSTPFTAYLSDIVGPGNVTGFDNDFLDTDKTHFAFGIRKKFIEETKINFKFSHINEIDSKDNYFDRVYCISVLEHIENPAVWQKGLMEMARILKPGGKLILTFDFSVSHKFVSIGDILNYTGLLPGNFLNMNWPKKRFVNVDGMAMDVYGLVLTKPDHSVFIDNTETNTVNSGEIMKKFIPEITFPNQLQIAKDINRGKLLTMTKILLNRYKK